MDECVCVIGNVYVRFGVGIIYLIFGILFIDFCFVFKGYLLIVSGIYWVNVDYYG